MSERSGCVPVSAMTTLRAWIIVAACLMWAGSALTQSAYGQVPGLPELIAGEKAGGTIPPAGVTRQGQIEVTGVELDGRQLFEIASPTVPDRAQPGDLMPVEDRARDIERKLQRLLLPDTGAGKTPEREQATRLDPETMRIRTEMRNGLPVLVATDPRAAVSEELIRVTDADVQHHGLRRQELAAHWQETLERELRSALQSRQPEATRFRLLRLAGILLAALLSTMVLGRISSALVKRKTQLRDEQERAEQATASHAAASQAATAKASASREAAVPHAETSDTISARNAVAAEREERRERNLLSHVLHEQFGVSRRRQLVRLLLSLVSWAIVFIWVAAIAAAFYEFPQTRGIADRIVSIPVLILVAGFAAGLANGLAGLLIDRIANALSRRSDARTSLRVPTVAAAVKGLVAAILYLIAMIAVLEYVLVIPFTVVALGAIAALALSFAAQNLVKDLVNGVLILVEDQYALGDDIVVGSASGVVERLHLRSTQLRTADGRLITIPNHMISQVENKTRLWSRVDLRVTVAYATDVDRALAVVEQVAEETARDPRWRRLIMDAPELLGVEEISHQGIVIRFHVKTLPFKKEDVARALRRRLKIAFDRERIAIGIPQQAIVGGARADDEVSGGTFRDRSSEENQHHAADTGLHS